MKQEKYSSTFLSMDIETSKVVLNDGTPFQIVYSVSVQIMDTKTNLMTTKLFRTLEEFINFLKSNNIVKLLNIKRKQRILCFIHNLDYEFTFLRRIIGGEFLKSDTELDDYGGLRSLSTIRDTHAPISIIFERLPHIEFRCTYALTGKGIKKLGEEQFNLALEKIKEREGDEFTKSVKPFILQNSKKLEMDYDKVFYPWDELDTDMVEYNHRDTLIPVRHVLQMLENGYTLDNLPLTKTSIVVKDRYNHTQKYYPEQTEKKNNNNQLRKCTNRFLYHIPSYKQYELECLTYYGGTTTCHPNFVNRLLKNVYSVDIKSSYPTVMVQEYFPDYDDKCKKHYYENSNQYFKEHLEGLDSKHLIIKDNKNVDKVRGFKGIFTFTNVRIKDVRLFPTHSIDKSLKQKIRGNSKFKCEEYEKFNGKLIKAKCISFAFNNVGMDCFNLIYDYDDVICEELITTTKIKKLPPNEITFVLEAFALKESLPKDSFEQRKQKENVNSTYGMKVQKMIKNLYLMEEGNIQVQDFYGNDLTDKEKEEIYNFHCKLVKEQYGKNSKTNRLMKRWDIFSDGTYITDYARYNLLKMVVYLTNVGFQCIYTDTDSIKFTLDEWQYNEVSKKEITEVNEIVSDMFNEYNSKNEQNNRENLHFQQVKQWLNLSEKDFNKIVKLGDFELESGYKENDVFIIEPYPYFKYLGAKKYACISKKNTNELKLKTTIAGCSDKNLPKAIISHSKLTGYDLHESMNLCFQTGIVYDNEVSGRTTAYYEKRTKEELDNLWFYEQRVNEDGERVYNDNKIYLKDLKQMGGVVIEDTNYTLNLSESDCNFLDIKYHKEPFYTLHIDGTLEKNIKK